MFDTSRARTQDVRSIIAGIADNHAGSQVAWRFVQMYWEKLLEQFGAGSFTMGAIIESVIGESMPKVLCKPHYGNSHLEMEV